MTNPTPTPPMPEPAAPAAGSSERAAWDRLDVVAKRIHAAWLRDHPQAAEALDAHPQRDLILAALGYGGRAVVGL